MERSLVDQHDDRTKAEQYYKQAQSVADLTSEFHCSGGYVTSVEDYLRRKEYSEACKLPAKIILRIDPFGFYSRQIEKENR